MKLRTESVLDRLVADEPCLGAAFTSFTFDPTFFEQHVLAAVLRLGSDPAEDTARYYDEACSALQEVPVACVVDARMRPGGHQLPYDLREVRGRTFHPKVALLVYGGFARLSVASGNLTEAGYGRNAEMFFVRDLRYTEPDDAAVLREAVALLRAIDGFAAPKGNQLAAVLDAVERRIADTPDPTERALRLLHTEHGGPLLEQVLALLPPNAKLSRIGLLAPFFEQDDQDAADADSASAVLTALAARAGKDTTLDLGVSWEQASVAPGPAATTSPDVTAGLWATREDDGDRVSYLTVVSATANSYRCVDASGTSRLLPKESVESRIARGEMWRAGTPTVYAPGRLIEVASARLGAVSTWLFPSPQVDESRVVDRPLHAKGLTLTYRRGKATETLVVVGSANASRKAMLETPASGGNVEACVAFVVEGELALHELAPGLVHCAAPVEWAQRAMIEPPPLPSIPWIESAELDGATRTLDIRWSDTGGAEVGTWRLEYAGQDLARGTGVPTSSLVITPFDLTAASCELVVSAHDGERAFPIIVKDLTALVFDASTRALDLRALLALVGRRLTLERHRTIQATYGGIVGDEVLTTLLGEGFAPTDVFRAWWTVAHDLCDPSLSLAGFRLRLEGAIGAGAVWSRIREVADGAEGEISREEAWFYGAELRRELGALELPPGADAAAKREVLVRFVAGLSADLERFPPAVDGRPWVEHIVTFYGGRA